MNVPAELEADVADARAKVRFGYPWWLRPLLMANVIAITIGHRVWISCTLRHVTTTRARPLHRRGSKNACVLGWKCASKRNTCVSS